MLSFILLLNLFSVKKGIVSDPILTVAYYVRGIKGGWKLESKKIGVNGARSNPFGLPLHSLHYFIIFLAGPIVSIISTERIIASNGLTMTGVTESTGQMIALFAGVTSMCTTIWELAIWWKICNKPTSTASGPRDEDGPYIDLENIPAQCSPRIVRFG
jgi:hypothetical protein